MAKQLFISNVPTNIPIIFSPESVSQLKQKIALIYRYYEDNQYVIFVDETFDRMPQTCKRFVIYHEHGHLNNEMKDRRTLECELKADAYAVKMIGRKPSVEALKYIWGIMWATDPWSCLDIPTRLKELGENVDGMRLAMPNGQLLCESDLRKLLK